MTYSNRSLEQHKTLEKISLWCIVNGKLCKKEICNLAIVGKT